MANAIIHSQSSVKKFGGKLEDYLTIHEKMDCSKAYISDNRHRALTHTMFWVKEVMIPIYGSYIEVTKNDKLIKVSVKDICEQHILEDFRMKFIPTAQDFLQEMEFKEWMQNGKGVCPSATKLYPELIKQEGFIPPSGMVLDGNQGIAPLVQRVEDLEKMKRDILKNGIGTRVSD